MWTRVVGEISSVREGDSFWVYGWCKLNGLIQRIYITRNGKVVAKLSNPYQDRVDVAKSLFGVLSNDMTLEEAREESLNTI